MAYEDGLDVLIGQVLCAAFLVKVFGGGGEHSVELKLGLPCSQLRANCVRETS